jgi:hypothetical protein
LVVELNGSKPPILIDNPIYWIWPDFISFLYIAPHLFLVSSLMLYLSSLTTNFPWTFRSTWWWARAIRYVCVASESSNFHEAFEWIGKNTILNQKVCINGKIVVTTSYWIIGIQRYHLIYFCSFNFSRVFFLLISCFGNCIVVVLNFYLHYTHDPVNTALLVVYLTAPRFQLVGIHGNKPNRHRNGAGACNCCV